MPSRYTLPDSDTLKTARERFKRASDADTEQAERERDDISFEQGNQWPDDIRRSRQGQTRSEAIPYDIAARPTLVINKVKEPVRQILNQERASDIGIELVPADDFGDLGLTPDDTEITLREGLVRRIQRESVAADARTWAFKRAVIAGRGYYLVMTRYLPGKTNDQEIYIHRIYNQAGVLLDPSHERPDGSDADWAFVGTWVPWDRFKAEYPTLADGSGNPFANGTVDDFTALHDDSPDWYSLDGDYRAVRVVDYWYTERTTKTLATLPDGTAVWAEDVPEGVTPVDTRTVVEKAIKFCKIGGGVLELEETDWAGPDMPIVKVLGDELLPHDQQRRAEGVVRPMRDSGMGENYMVSKLVEQVGLTPIPPLQLDPEAIEGYEPWYAVMNTRPVPWAPYRSYDDQGRPLNPPTRLNVDPNILPVSQAIAMFDGFIQQTTGGSAPDRLGVGQRVQADRAIKRLQDEEQFNTSNYLDNLARSIRYEGQIINGLLYPIYGAKPGRLVRILTGIGEHETMVVADPQRPTAPQGMSPQQQQGQRAAKVGKLTKDANFNVIVKVTKAYESRRSQEATALGELIAANPEFMTWFGDIYFSNSDMPNRKQAAERAKVMLAPPIQQMLQQKEQGQEIPAAAQQQIAQLTQRLQEAEAVMQGQHQAIETKQIETQGKLQIEQMTIQGKVELERVTMQRDLALEQVRQQTELEKVRQDNATKMYIAELQAKTQGVLQAAEAEHEMVASAHAQSHEAEQRDLDRENETRMAAHAAATADGQQDRSEAEAERGRQATAEQADADRQAQTQQPEA